MKFVYYCLTVVIVLIQACQSNPNESLAEGHHTISSQYPGNDNFDISKFDKSNPYNQLALFLAGKESTLYKKQQNIQAYKNYKIKLETSWDVSNEKKLKSIKRWAEKEQLQLKDSLPLFYPFSGPDFLYANAFFPNAPVHIMVGLENPGKMPNLASMSDEQMNTYLYKLYHSLRYINQAGYFTTKQMQTDFADSELNGIIHLICFYLAKTGHQIAKITPVKIDHYGELKEKRNFQVADEFINGIKFYVINKNKELKTIYYFPLDLSDENLKDQFGFLTFISQFGKKNTFMKAASYLLHSNEFDIISDLILKQSQTIVQDDTGFPYHALKDEGFSIQLFGNYTRTIKMFSTFYQPDLKKALAEKKAKQLPFKLGYNSWKNEMVLMIAHQTNVKARKPITYKTEKQGVIFKVQIKSSWKKIPEEADLFKGLPKVDHYYSDNLYKYTIGEFSSEQACNNYLQIAVNKGFEDAFVVAFYKKNRISLEEAARIMEQ